MDALRFDAATADDVDVLLSLARAFHAEDGHALSEAGAAALAAVAGGEPLARGWLVRQADAAIGYVVLSLGFSIEHGGRDGFIDDLYIVPAAVAAASAGRCWPSPSPRRRGSASACSTSRWSRGTSGPMTSIGRTALSRAAGG